MYFITDSDYGLSPAWHQAIIWTNDGLLSIGVSWTIRNKLQWNLNQNSTIFIQENGFEYVVYNFAVILLQFQICYWCKCNIYHNIYLLFSMTSQRMCLIGFCWFINSLAPARCSNHHQLSNTLEIEGGRYTKTKTDIYKRLCAVWIKNDADAMCLIYLAVLHTLLCFYFYLCYMCVFMLCQKLWKIKLCNQLMCNPRSHVMSMAWAFCENALRLILKNAFDNKSILVQVRYLCLGTISLSRKGIHALCKVLFYILQFKLRLQNSQCWPIKN